jgi:hypothetical protein
MLAKQHANYAQRAHIRAYYIKKLIDEEKVPAWALRIEAPPAYFAPLSKEMVALQKRHASEYAKQVYIELIQREREDSETAEEYLELVKDVYEKSSDSNFTKAANALTDILGKYRSQDIERQEKLRIEDLEAYPKDDQAWENVVISNPKKSGVVRDRSRDNSSSRQNSRERKRKRDQDSRDEMDNAMPTQSSSNRDSSTESNRSGPKKSNLKVKNPGYQNQRNQSGGRGGGTPPQRGRGQFRGRGSQRGQGNQRPQVRGQWGQGQQQYQQYQQQPQRPGQKRSQAREGSHNRRDMRDLNSGEQSLVNALKDLLKNH